MKKIILITAVLVFAGCATCPPPEVVEVQVPIPVQAPPLPVPETPDWQTPDADPSDVNAYVRALVHDLVASWKWGVEMKHVIESHNKVMSDGTD